MMKWRRWLLTVLTCSFIATGSLGLAACGGVSPNESGGKVESGAGNGENSSSVSLDDSENNHSSDDSNMGGVDSDSSTESKKEILGTPQISMADGGYVYWNNVSNAAYYLVEILPNGEIVDAQNTFILLEAYYGNSKKLQIRVQAIAEEDGNYTDSAWSDLYTFEIPETTEVREKGIGDAVNLLAGSYTEFAQQATMIFDKTQFSRIQLNTDTTMSGSSTNVYYTDDLISYLDSRSVKANSKLSNSASAGMDGLGKLTMGYKFDVGASYERKASGKTTTVFYNLDYTDIVNTQSIDEYTVSEELPYILSEAFLADAQKVNIGTMSAGQFINRYGTHIVTAGVYGAWMNIHYELIADETTLETTNSTELLAGINTAVSGSIKGVDLEVSKEQSYSLDTKHFITDTTADKRTVFSATTKGGARGTFTGVTSLEDCAAKSAAWGASLNNSDPELIDVPDGSLYCVWDFLDNTYANAKSVLNAYFMEKSGASYDALKSKVSKIYLDTAVFDEKTATLTVDFADLQTYSSADLSYIGYGAGYGGSENGWYNGNTGVFTVYSYFNGQPIEKVVFKGNYYQRDQQGRVIKTMFNDFAIVFDENWIEDIAIEFDSFAYVAPNEMIGLDIGKVESNSIEINTVGKVYIKGGDSVTTGTDGANAIVGSNFTFSGDADSNMEIHGGNGTDGVAQGENGTHGGHGVVGKNMIVATLGALNVYGGNGGDGAVGRKGADGAKGKDQGNGNANKGGAGGNGAVGGTGGAGGMGASAIVADKVVLHTPIIVKAGDGGVGGTGGIGGNGGAGGQGGSQYNFFHTSAGDGGDGGYGGAGGAGGKGGDVDKAIKSASISGTYTENTSYVGAGGAGGAGGFGGAGGPGGWKCTGAGSIHDSVTMIQMSSGKSHSSEQAQSGADGLSGSKM